MLGPTGVYHRIGPRTFHSESYNSGAYIHIPTHIHVAPVLPEKKSTKQILIADVTSMLNAIQVSTSLDHGLMLAKKELQTWANGCLPPHRSTHPPL